MLRAEAEAGQLRAAADDDARTAEDLAAERDTAAVALAQAWRAWSGDTGTGALLGEIDWPAHPLVGPLILDAEALAGDGDVPLDGLDEVADTSARPARASVEAARARLDREASDDREREAALRTERADLAAERDPKPADPPWLDAGRAGEPLWRCVDFADQVSNEQRAGLEGALLAAGLLSAVVQPDGTVLAADGELLISPGTARPGRSLATVLRPDPAAGLPADTIAAVLAAVGYEDPGAATAVFADGRWRNGPLRGRHVAGRARHIGAAARAAHRRERITQIDAELAVLDERARRRERQHAELDGTVRGLDALVRAAPRSTELYAARRVAAESRRRAERSAARADQEAQRARQKRTAWAGEMSTHQATCAHHGLPAEAAALDRIAAAARRARDSSGRLGEELTPPGRPGAPARRTAAAGRGSRRTARRHRTGRGRSLVPLARRGQRACIPARRGRSFHRAGPGRAGPHQDGAGPRVPGPGSGHPGVQRAGPAARHGARVEPPRRR